MRDQSESADFERWHNVEEHREINQNRPQRSNDIGDLAIKAQLR
jgi:hypothetical protein